MPLTSPRIPRLRYPPERVVDHGTTGDFLQWGSTRAIANEPDGGDEFTVELVFRPDITISVNTIAGQNAASSTGWYFYRSGTVLQFVINDTDTYDWGIGSLVAGNWYYVAVTYSPSTAGNYVRCYGALLGKSLAGTNINTDGLLRGTAYTLVDDMVESNFGTRFLRSAWTTEFDGKGMMLRVWRRALSEGELRQVWNKRWSHLSETPFPDLAFYYDAGNGPTAENVGGTGVYRDMATGEAATGTGGVDFNLLQGRQLGIETVGERQRWWAVLAASGATTLKSIDGAVGAFAVAFSKRTSIASRVTGTVGAVSNTIEKLTKRFLYGLAPSADISAALGETTGDPLYEPRLDLNSNGIINSTDLLLAHLFTGSNTRQRTAFSSLVGAVPDTISGALNHVRTSFSSLVGAIPDTISGAISSTKTQFSSITGTAGALAASIEKRISTSPIGATGAVTGSLLRETRKNLAGATAAVSGVLTPAVLYLRSVAGTVGALSASIVKRTSTSPVGTAGALAGSLLRETRKNLAGVPGDIAGSISTGALFLKSLIGDTGSMVGSLVFRTSKIFEGTAGDVSATLTRLTYKSFSGAPGTISGSLVRLTKTILSGAFDAAATLGRSLLPGGAGGATFTAALAGAVGTLTGTVASYHLASFNAVVGMAIGSVRKVRTIIHTARRPQS